MWVNQRGWVEGTLSLYGRRGKCIILVRKSEGKRLCGRNKYTSENKNLLLNIKRLIVIVLYEFMFIWLRLGPVLWRFEPNDEKSVL